MLASQQSIPTEIALLILVLGVVIFIWDLLERRRETLQKGGGLDQSAELISLRGSNDLPPKEYYSKSLALSSRPDALLKEGGAIIPVDHKPLSNKVRDRHVIAMLLHMKLIEEIEGIRPPYGILLMGNKRRSTRIKNTEEKMRWLDAVIDEMRSIEDGVPAAPSPSVTKCRNCDVRKECEHSKA
jgi:CRISPR/Cas system-associated exonuclease Cas4 (RecB family)